MPASKKDLIHQALTSLAASGVDPLEVIREAYDARRRQELQTQFGQFDGKINWPSFNPVDWAALKTAVSGPEFVCPGDWSQSLAEAAEAAQQDDQARFYKALLLVFAGYLRQCNMQLA